MNRIRVIVSVSIEIKQILNMSLNKDTIRLVDIKLVILDWKFTKLFTKNRR